MTDEELIARLLEEETDLTDCAADRIEALTKERDEAMQLLKTLSNMNGDLSRDLYKTKLLLAKAVEALGLIVVDNTWGLEHETYMKCRKALAEIKGESHE